MLFDLRGAGRRRTVKVVYISLAFLMGGGLVLFGIGGSVSGGLVDAITGADGGGDTGAAATSPQAGEDRRARGRQTRANPTDAPAWAALARARFQLAGQGANFDVEKSNFTAAGTAKLRAAEQAWDRYLALDPPKPDDRVASLMVQAFGALNKPDKAAQAQEVITDARPTASTFTQLAVFAYQAGQTRKGDLARDKAIELTEPDMREALKGQLEQAKTSATTQSISPPTHPRREQTFPEGSGGDPAKRPRSSPGRVRLLRQAHAGSTLLRHALVAQLAEQRTLNPKVPGSIPGGGIDKAC